MGSDRDINRSQGGKDTCRIGKGGGRRALLLKLSFEPKGDRIKACDKSGSDRETKRSQGGKDSCRTGYGGGRTRLTSPTKLGLPVAGETAVPVASIRLLGFFFCFLCHSSGESRRTGTLGTDEDASEPGEPRDWRRSW